MIKRNVKIYDFAKLENNMDTKEDIKGMDNKEYIQYLKELTKNIKHNCIPHLSTQEEDKEEKYDLF